MVELKYINEPYASFVDAVFSSSNGYYKIYIDNYFCGLIGSEPPVTFDNIEKLMSLAYELGKNRINS